MSQTEVHTQPFFMSRLHNEKAGARGYNFEPVQNNVSRIYGGLESPDELYIPINVDNTHWHFIRVAMTYKTIQRFDSQGENTSNNKFLQAVEKYMHDTITKNVEEQRQDFNV